MTARPAITAPGRTAVDLACVIHVHSRFSDGTATVPEIVSATRAAGADAVLLTDHDSLEARRQGLEGWHGEQLLLVGHEVTAEVGHLLVFGVDEEVDHRGRSEADICAEVDSRRGIAFAAHPFSEGGLIPSIIRPHPWRALPECESCGIELWSLMTDTAERWRTPAQAVRFLLDPLASLDGPPSEHLAQWDRLCARRRVPAIGGLDAHQTGLRLGRRVISPMPHERYFALLRTHVLLENPLSHELAADRAAVYEALQAGRCFLALDAIAPARGFDFCARAADGTVATMGSEVRRGRWSLAVSAPRATLLRLVRDGRTVAERRGVALVHETDEEAGVYRVEARIAVRGRPRLWIVSNPIYIR